MKNIYSKFSKLTSKISASASPITATPDTAAETEEGFFLCSPSDEESTPNQLQKNVINSKSSSTFFKDNDTKTTSSLNVTTFPESVPTLSPHCDNKKSIHVLPLTKNDTLVKSSPETQTTNVVREFPTKHFSSSNDDNCNTVADKPSYGLSSSSSLASLISLSSERRKRRSQSDALNIPFLDNPTDRHYCDDAIPSRVDSTPRINIEEAKMSSCSILTQKSLTHSLSSQIKDNDSENDAACTSALADYLKVKVDSKPSKERLGNDSKLFAYNKARDGPAIFRVLLIGFHHINGPVVEGVFPPLYSHNEQSGYVEYTETDISVKHDSISSNTQRECKETSVEINTGMDNSDAEDTETIRSKESIDREFVINVLKWIPFLALPDASHHSAADFVYFLAPFIEERFLYCVSCYQRIDANLLEFKDTDITRTHVQKAVCVLSHVPLFGIIQSRLERVTQAFFDQRDFRDTSILASFYENLNLYIDSLKIPYCDAFLNLEADLKLLLHQLRPKNVLLLLKALLLECKIVLYSGSAARASSAVLVLLSFFPKTVVFNSYPWKHEKTIQRRWKRMGLPFNICNPKNSVVYPYLSLQLLESIRTNEPYLIGVTNKVLIDNPLLIPDIIADIDSSRIDIVNKDLIPALSLTDYDLTFVRQHLVSTHRNLFQHLRITNNNNTSHSKNNNFNTTSYRGTTKEGRDSPNPQRRNSNQELLSRHESTSDNDSSDYIISSVTTSPKQHSESISTSRTPLEQQPKDNTVEVVSDQKESHTTNSVCLPIPTRKSTNPYKNVIENNTPPTSQTPTASKEDPNNNLGTTTANAVSGKRRLRNVFRLHWKSNASSRDTPQTDTINNKPSQEVPSSPATTPVSSCNIGEDKTIDMQDKSEDNDDQCEDQQQQRKCLSPLQLKASLSCLSSNDISHIVKRQQEEQQQQQYMLVDSTNSPTLIYRGIQGWWKKSTHMNRHNSRQITNRLPSLLVALYGTSIVELCRQNNKTINGKFGYKQHIKLVSLAPHLPKGFSGMNLADLDQFNNETINIETTSFENHEKKKTFSDVIQQHAEQQNNKKQNVTATCLFKLNKGHLTKTITKHPNSETHECEVPSLEFLSTTSSPLARQPSFCEEQSFNVCDKKNVAMSNARDAFFNYIEIFLRLLAFAAGPERSSIELKKAIQTKHFGLKDFGLDFLKLWIETKNCKTWLHAHQLPTIARFTKLPRAGWVIHTYPNGDEYVGQVFQGQRHGKGIYISATGVYYEGDWDSNKRHGGGVIVDETCGIYYIGQWSNDKKNGNGQLTTSVESYWGEFVNDVFHGKGLYIDRLGDQYEGDFQYGQLHGAGKLKRATGEVVSGEWISGELSGCGSRFYSDGRTYVGDFLKNEPDGEGVMTFPDGSTFDGYWTLGKREGDGILTIPVSVFPYADIHRSQMRRQTTEKSPKNLNPDTTFKTKSSNLSTPQCLESMVIQGKWSNDRPSAATEVVWSIAFPTGDKYTGNLKIDYTKPKLPYIITPSLLLSVTDCIRFSQCPKLEPVSQVMSRVVKRLQEWSLKEESEKNIGTHTICQCQSLPMLLSASHSSTPKSSATSIIVPATTPRRASANAALQPTLFGADEIKECDLSQLPLTQLLQRLSTLPEGRGLSTSSQDNTVYTGAWYNGMRHGKGEVIWDDGSRYRGDWAYGLQHGSGTYVSCEGRVKSGYFEKDLLTFTTEDLQSIALSTEEAEQDFIETTHLPNKPQPSDLSNATNDWTIFKPFVYWPIETCHYFKSSLVPDEVQVKLKAWRKVFQQC